MSKYQKPFQEVIRGALYPFRSIRYILSNGLLRTTFISIFINIILLFLLIYFSFSWVETRLLTIEEWIYHLFDFKIWDFFASIFIFFIKIAIYMLILILDSVLLSLLGETFASPFLDKLSESVEFIELGDEKTGSFTVTDIIQLVFFMLRNIACGLLFLIIIYGGLFIATLIVPLIGIISPIITCPLAFLITTHTYTALPMERNKISYKKRWEIIWENKWLSLGFGISVTFLLLIPIINFTLLPLATVGGTLFYCDWVQSNQRSDVPSKKID